MVLHGFSSFVGNIGPLQKTFGNDSDLMDLVFSKLVQLLYKALVENKRRQRAVE